MTMRIEISIDHDDQWERRSSMVEALTSALAGQPDPYLDGRSVTFTFSDDGLRQTPHPIVLLGDGRYTLGHGTQSDGGNQ